MTEFNILHLLGIFLVLLGTFKIADTVLFCSSPLSSAISSPPCYTKAPRPLTGGAQQTLTTMPTARMN